MYLNVYFGIPLGASIDNSIDGQFYCYMICLVFAMATIFDKQFHIPASLSTADNIAKYSEARYIMQNRQVMTQDIKS